jgi:hypothetical protein
MKNLKRIGLCVTLVCVLATVAFADDSQCAPGTVNSPPCAAAQVTPDDSVSPGDTNSPPASNAGDAASVTKLAVDLLQSVLLLF